MKQNPNLEWVIDPSIMHSFDNLSDDSKASNLAAAQRIPDHLALIGFAIEPLSANDDGSWKANLATAISKHLDRLAKAEHLGWCAERKVQGQKEEIE